MDFIDNGDVQFFKYLVTNDPTSKSLSSLPIGTGYGIGTYTRQIYVYPESRGSVFFRVPLLDKYIENVCNNKGISLADDGYRCVWVNSNRVYKSTTDYNCLSYMLNGTILTRSDDEDLYGYSDTALYIGDVSGTEDKGFVASTVQLNVLLFCGGENRLATIDDLNRIWKGLGTMDHDQNIDNIFDKPLYEDCDRESMCPTWDYEYDSYTGKFAYNANTNSSSLDTTICSLYNTQPGNSGSILFIPKPVDGNMILMKNVYVPIIMMGYHGTDTVSLSSSNSKHIIQPARSLVGSSMGNFITVLGEDNEVIELGCKNSSHRNTHLTQEFIITIGTGANLRTSGVLKTKYMRDERTVINEPYYTNGTDNTFPSSYSAGTAKWALGKRFSQVYIPKYWVTGTGCLYNTNRGGLTPTDMVQSVVINNNSSYNIYTYLDGLKLPLHSFDLSLSTAPSVTSNFETLCIPRKYGNVDVITNKFFVFKTYMRWNDKTYPSHTRRNRTYKFDLNGYRCTSDENTELTETNITMSNLTNTSTGGGYYSDIDTMVSGKLPNEMFYLTNVGVVLQGINVINKGGTSAGNLTSTLEGKSGIFNYTDRSSKSISDGMTIDLCKIPLNGNTISEVKTYITLYRP